MTPEQILKKASEKAVKNGYEGEFEYRSMGLCKFIEKRKSGNTYWEQASCEAFIFSHSFAKAFWKHPKECKVGEPLCSNHAPWQAYLQKMVLEKEPLKYLEKHL